MSRQPIADDAALLLVAGADPDALAIIWLTVDTERVLAGIGATGVALASDPHLGATVRLVRPPDGPPIALLEPNTEGRVAGSLARNGEGPAGRYVTATDGLSSVEARAAAAGIALSAQERGPFGASVLVLGGSPAGPYLVLVDPSTGTIDP
jgi:hypothetical protein